MLDQEKVLKAINILKQEIEKYSIVNEELKQEIANVKEENKRLEAAILNIKGSQ